LVVSKHLSCLRELWLESLFICNILGGTTWQ
jgi:hypothetical protein